VPTYGIRKPFSYVYPFGMDSATKKFAFRFTQRTSKIATKIHIYIWSASSPPVYRLGLQEDAGGFPSGKWLSYGEFTPVAGYNSVSVNASLKEATSYWIVMEYASGVIDSTHYCCPHTHVYSPHYMYPDDFEDADYRLLTSSDGGLTWSSLDYDAVWVVEYSDGSGYGQPYETTWWGTIFGDYIVGMRIQPESRRLVSKVFLQLAKFGAPPNDLSVILYNITDGVEEARTTFSAASIPDFPPFPYTVTWTEWAFPTPLTLLPTKTYRLYMKTVGGDSDNCYLWAYLRLWWDIDIIIETSWGGSINCDEESEDGGLTWRTMDNIDMGFYFVTLMNPAIKTAPNSGL
jgi:hypothetical protein